MDNTSLLEDVVETHVQQVFLTHRHTVHIKRCFHLIKREFNYTRFPYQTSHVFILNK